MRPEARSLNLSNSVAILTYEALRQTGFPGLLRHRRNGQQEHNNYALLSKRKDAYHMNYNKKTVMDVDVAGKKVLLRCDFNVPQDKATGAITSDKRIVAALPTIRYLLEQGRGGDRLFPSGQAQGRVEGKAEPCPCGEASQ